MCRNKILEKLLAIILIFTLTFANFAFVTECLAISFVETLFGENSDTGHKNVEFEAFFGTDEEKETSVISDVNNEEISISFNLNVHDDGYLKDAKIEIAEIEEGNGLNFEIKKDFELPEMVQSLEENILSLRQIEHSSDVKFSLPIEYVNEKYVNENNLSKDAKIIFTGIYVDEEGEETEVSREIVLNVSWKDEREIRIETGVTKSIDFGEGVILQTSVKVDNSNEGNTLPVKNSEIQIEVPTLEGVSPSNITVVANTTEGTNGKTAGDLSFNEENWNYDMENGVLTISVENSKELVVVEENPEEFLKEENEEVVEEERYYSKSGIDEFLVTYTFEGVSLNESTTISSNTTAKITTFSGVEKDEYINKTENNEQSEFALEGQTGDIVSLNIENETKEVSKAYMYINYNHNEKHEIEYKSKTILNISYKDIVENLFVEDVDNFYLDKEGNRISTDDMYYKQIKVSKENFDSILGEDGAIKILDLEGNELVVLNKEYEVDEEGNYVFNFENRYSKLNIKTTAPVGEGNIVISNTRAMKNTSLDKETLKNIASIGNEQKIKANYSYVETEVEVESAEVTTNLLDTITNPTLVIDRDNLSTLAMNDNVELRIELNNATEKSDLYGNSTFDIELPGYVQYLEVTNAEIVYGEGLEISSVEVLDKTIRVTINGVQNGINSGVLTNGTNIEINANIKVDLYTPAKTDVIKLHYTNNEATNYENNGVKELDINYSAPSGLITINSTSNYNNIGSILTSVRQGSQIDLIDIYSEAKVATMEIIVMNNNSNTVSNVSILGRIPFKGVKDIETGEELGTTLDTKMLSGIASDEHNKASFTVYYSANGEATKDIADESNGWTMNPEILENVRSYLIVPVDSEYEMQEAEILRFTYQYEIPGNLPHNEEIYGTYLAYYTNNSEVAITDETSVPDKVGLTTGEGPELSIGVSADRNIVKEYEELKVTINVSNIGEDVAKDINVALPIPTYTTYKNVVSEMEGLTAEIVDNKVVIKSNELEKNKTIECTVVLNASKLPTISQYYKNTEGFMQREDGNYVIRTYSKTEEEIENSEFDEEVTFTDEIITEIPDVNIEIKASVTAKDLGTELVSEVTKVNLKEAEFSITEYSSDDAYVQEPQDLGTELELRIDARNLSSKDKTNVVVTKVLPEEFEFVSAFMFGVDGNNVENASYDEQTRTITWKIDKLVARRTANLSYVIKVKTLPEGTTEHTLNLTSQVVADGTETYTSNTLPIQIGRAILTVSQTTTTTDTYVKEGSTITYVFNVKNEGSVRAKQVSLVDEIPEGLIVRSISFTSDGILTKKRVSTNDKAVVDLTILPKTEAVITIEALASSLFGVQEKTVTNSAIVSADNVEMQKTNEITHIIEADQRAANDVIEESKPSSSNNSGSVSNNIVKTYKMNGTAWLDENENGMRDLGEQLLPGISVKLINSETGVITKSVTTDSDGTYTFTGVKNGNYLVLFDYDTVKYTVTTYHKSDVAPNVNSDAITTQIEQNGKIRNGAVTDVITLTDGSISNVDIGFVLADTFDLELEKTITKLMTQTKAGTTNEQYDNSDFVKTEIAAKHVVGSTVYIEYLITVKNVGDIAGYAKKIVDYIPNEMTFNSSLGENSNWYTGTDGNLYTTALSDLELVSGQSAQVKLILAKQLTEDNTGIINNVAEIYEDYNIYGISDKNSTPANKAQGENDMDFADTAILIKTGEVFIYISVIITSMLLGSIVVFIGYSQIVYRKRKGGV